MLMSWHTLLSVAFGYIILTKSCTSKKKTEYNTGAARKQYVAIALAQFIAYRHQRCTASAQFQIWNAVTQHIASKYAVHIHNA